LTIEFTHMHQSENPLTAERSTLFCPPSTVYPHWIKARDRPNILKTLNTDNQQYPIETTYRPLAAQPCSYIYPIYSVVKNRPRQHLVAQHAAGALGAAAWVYADLSMPAQS
jgi:hypothetical protein